MVHHSSAPWHKGSPHHLALKSRFRPFFDHILLYLARLGARAANDQMHGQPGHFMLRGLDHTNLVQESTEAYNCNSRAAAKNNIWGWEGGGGGGGGKLMYCVHIIIRVTSILL